ncbi:invasion protein [Aliidiomarina taiwanensis]|uniref:Invasion protein n=1 Tax=Aliidiomarina taiwanensis TaxID=946228 RepID=A0A432X9B4_9GAMM|nr:SirB2 family protein [Aliidiomarina taiwanensis]RUO43906.1 invasion protein [Aliidiomarina taiwanensis]
MYLMFKHLHATLAMLSLVFLLLRIFLAWKDAAVLDKKWLKVTPHAVDGLFVASIVGLLIATQAHPFTSSFHTEKLIGFIAYIAFSVLTVLALRGRFPIKLKAPFAAMAILTWFWMVKVAMLKQPILLASL